MWRVCLMESLRMLLVESDLINYILEQNKQLIEDGQYTKEDLYAAVEELSKEELVETIFANLRNCIMTSMGEGGKLM